MAYDSYQMIQNVTSANPREIMLEEKKYQVEYLYGLAMDREDGCLLNGIPFIQSPRIFDRKTKNNNSQTITVETIAKSDKFYEGDLLSFDNNHWLCTTSFEFHKLYCKGTFVKCNYTLKFQHPKTGVILSYPCIDEVSNMSVGVDEGKVISTGNAIKSIKLPFNQNTILIDVDDRFFIDDLSVEKPQVFAVTKPNRITYKGLIELTLKQDEYNPKTDDRELGICGKKEAPTLPSQGETSSIIESNGELNLGYSRVITATAYNIDGTKNNDIQLVWNIIYPTGYEGYFTQVINGNNCTISVKYGAYELIDMEVLISVDDGNSEYVGNKTFIVSVL